MDAFERIDSWLNENHMSRRQLAIKAGIPPSTFQSAMERRNKMSDRMLRAIAPIMGTTVDALITEYDLETPSGGHVRMMNHPESEFVALDITKLSMEEILSFCRISKSGGLSEGILCSLLIDAIRFYLGKLDYAALEEVAEKILELSAGSATQPELKE